MRLPHGYTNETHVENGVVRKHYAGSDAGVRLEVEARALTRLGGYLPVPRVVELVHDALDLYLERLEGRPGQELIDEGKGASVLFACGTLLKRFQSLPPALLDHSHLSGSVIVHGDFGPQNLLFSDPDLSVAEIVDWEWAHVGDRLEDLAWAEWIVRTHHPDVVSHLPRLFEGYEETRKWQDRQAEMMKRCGRIVEIARSEGHAAAKIWEDRLRRTEAFEER